MLNEIKRTDFDTGITLQVAIKENRYKSLNLICIAKKKKNYNIEAITFIVGSINFFIL